MSPASARALLSTEPSPTVIFVLAILFVHIILHTSQLKAYSYHADNIKYYSSMTSNIACKLCGRPITFDDKHIGVKTGRKIPLDPGTNETHDCPVRRKSSYQKHQYPQEQQERREGQYQEQEVVEEHQSRRRQFIPCKNGCGGLIFFHPYKRTPSAWIPLDKQTGEAHHCPSFTTTGLET
jgi:hypothetical protein